MTLRSQLTALGLLTLTTLTLGCSQPDRVDAEVNGDVETVEASISAPDTEALAAPTPTKNDQVLADAVPETAENAIKLAEPRPLTPQELATISENMPVEGREIISEHSFVIPVAGERTAALVVSEQAADIGTNNLRVDLFETDGSWVQTLPTNESADAWILWDVKVVSFPELSFDGPEPDVILLTEYMVGAGPTAAQPFPVTTIYLNEGGTFVTHQETNDYLTDQGVETINEAEDVLRNELMYLP